MYVYTYAQSPNKIFFSALWASVWSKNKEGAGAPGPSPRSATDVYTTGRGVYLLKSR